MPGALSPLETSARCCHDLAVCGLRTFSKRGTFDTAALALAVWLGVMALGDWLLGWVA